MNDSDVISNVAGGGNGSVLLHMTETRVLKFTKISY